MLTATYATYLTYLSYLTYATYVVGSRERYGRYYHKDN